MPTVTSLYIVKAPQNNSVYDQKSFVDRAMRCRFIHREFEIGSILQHERIIVDYLCVRLNVAISIPKIREISFEVQYTFYNSSMSIFGILLPLRGFQEKTLCPDNSEARCRDLR